MSELSPREMFSQACHAMWCEVMEKDGWTYGPVVDEAAKKHPAIAPFEELDLLDRRLAHDQSDNMAQGLLQEFDMSGSGARTGRSPPTSSARACGSCTGGGKRRNSPAPCTPAPSWDGSWRTTRDLCTPSGFAGTTTAR